MALRIFYIIITRMFDDLNNWLNENPAFFSDVESETERLGSASRIALAGAFSLPLAPVLLEGRLAESVEIVCDDESYDFWSSLLNDARVSRARMLTGQFDLIYAPMCINYMNQKDVVPFLFDCHDSLSAGGTLILSFHDSLHPDPGQGRLVPLWFSEQEVMTKYYTLEDVLNALGTIGFSIRDIREIEGEGIVHAVSLKCSL